MVEHVRPGTWVGDVGAHHGFFSLLALHLGASVVAFEGDPQSWPWLERNVLRIRERWPFRSQTARLVREYVTATTDWTRWPEPDLVKIDVDGGEREVLVGLLRTHRPRAIILSVHGRDLEAACRGLLTGYRIDEVKPHDVWLATRITAAYDGRCQER